MYHALSLSHSYQASTQVPQYPLRFCPAYVELGLEAQEAESDRLQSEQSYGKRKTRQT